MAEADPSIIQSVSHANNKTLAEAGAFAIAQQFQVMTTALQEHVAAAGRRGAMADAAMGASIKAMNEMDPQQAIALAKSIPADNAQMLSSLGAMIAQLQQVMKGAQTTPPDTSRP